MIFLRDLNQEQLQVVQEGDGPVLVLAGAGSGKTRTIAYRVAFLLEQGVPPQQILLLTFTNKAAKEMLHRVSQLLEKDPVGLWGGTFHSVANRILRLYANELGYSPRFAILDQDDVHTLIKSCVKTLSIESTGRRFPSPAKLSGIISYARNADRTLCEVIEERFFSDRDHIVLIERVAEVYETRKRLSDAMDFDDLLLRLRQLLKDVPTLRRQLSNQFHYVLVDEYQDTNVVQSDLVALFSEMHGNVLVVGDDAQSIYSFRAAEVKNILGFKERFVGTRVFRLTTNYRSTPEILAVANCSIEHNLNQFEKTLCAVCASSVKPSLVPLQTAAHEARFIAESIERARDDETPLSAMAVLFRAAFHSQSLEFELMKREIPYEYRGGLKFFERAHVKDVIAYLRVKANSKDEAAWLRVLGHQNGIGLTTAQKLVANMQHAGDLGDVSATEPSLSRRAMDGWSILRTTLQKLAHESQPSALIRLVMASDYRSYLEAQYPDAIERMEDLEQFALFAEQAKDLTTFLNEVSLTDEYGGLRTAKADAWEQDRVVLSTIHQAKGLEWDMVFVMHVADGKFPNPRALDEEDGLEEERRLFYVATTRARKELVFTYPLMSGSDTLLIQQPSLFLQELPRSLFMHMKRHGFTDDRATDHAERTIVFDEFGEEVKLTDFHARISYLRNVDEL